MQQEEYISVTEFCNGHSISSTVISQLNEFGLVKIIQRSDSLYIPMEELPKTEKILRLHTDLNINLEGVEVITRLLKRIEKTEEELIKLRNKLSVYE
ncbi:chaperone modulator CbpM [Zobellia russellii]|uniref:chaperone modulator CbpM n=1 Tax=Zobellia russellii TaxID=248907 RepID=UPI001BFF3B4D|nr:chaperone modulator CbpM [Zobellia russellii]MBT9188837.1 MerR family transcriptional regulator [Zobellia russellii]